MRLQIKILFLTAIFIVLLGTSTLVMAQQNSASAEISTAQNELTNGFTAAKSAETAGANISQLTTTLDNAGLLLSNAELAYSKGNFGEAQNLAFQSQNLLGNFISNANNLQVLATQTRNSTFLLDVVGSITGTIAVLAGSALVWILLKRKYRTSQVKIVNLTQIKALFILITAVLALLIASPSLHQVLVSPQTRFFTELSLLGSEHSTGNYPFNITYNANYTVFLGVANQLGNCAYYQVEVKFRNETQSSPDTIGHAPSNLTSLYNLNAFVANRESLEIPVSFMLNYSINKVIETVYTNVSVSKGPGQKETYELIPENITVLQADVDKLIVNGESLNVQGFSSDWNPQTRQFYGNLIFELWVYNAGVNNFQYNDRYVDMKFNMTSVGMDQNFIIT